MLRKSHYFVEKILRAKGFTSPDSRRIMATQILLTGAALVLGMLFAGVTLWPLSFAMGTVIATINFWSLAQSVHRTIRHGYTNAYALAHFTGFLLRFAGTGGMLYLLAVRAALPVLPLLAGLFSVVIWLTILALFRTVRHSA